MGALVTGDEDVSYEIQGTNDLYVALREEHKNTALTIRAGDNWIEALDAGGKATSFGRYTNASWLKLNLTPALSWNNGVTAESSSGSKPKRMI